MARLARVVVPGYAHHITQRGNRRLPTFFSDADYEAYLAFLAEQCDACGVRIWAWCLMPNHLHLVAVPKTAEALARALGETHRRYTHRINLRKGWRGYLWQGRFGSFVMERAHVLAVVQYVERNPVRAGLVKRAWQWPWSSAAGHISGRGDVLVMPGGPLAAEVSNWRRFLTQAEDEAALEAIRRRGRTGRPWGASRFLGRLEKRLGRRVRPGQPGRPRKAKGK